MGGILSDMEETLEHGNYDALKLYVEQALMRRDAELLKYKSDVIRHQKILSDQMRDVIDQCNVLHHTNIAQFNLLSKAKQVLGEVIRGTLSYKATENKRLKKSDNTCIVAIDKNTLLHLQALFNDINYTIGTYAPLGSDALNQACAYNNK